MLYLVFNKTPTRVGVLEIFHLKLQLLHCSLPFIFYCTRLCERSYLRTPSPLFFRAGALQEVAETSEAYNRQRRKYGEAAEHPDPPPGAVAGAWGQLRTAEIRRENARLRLETMSNAYQVLFTLK